MNFGQFSLLDQKVKTKKSSTSILDLYKCGHIRPTKASPLVLNCHNNYDPNRIIIRKNAGTSLNILKYNKSNFRKNKDMEMVITPVTNTRQKEELLPIPTRKIIFRK